MESVTPSFLPCPSRVTLLPEPFWQTSNIVSRSCTQASKEHSLPPIFTLLYSAKVFPFLGAFIYTIATPSTTVAPTSGHSYLTDTFSPDGPLSWYRHFRKSDSVKVFKFFHNQTGQVNIGGSCGERIHLSQPVVIYIQGKVSSIAGHALSMLKLAFFP